MTDEVVKSKQHLLHTVPHLLLLLLTATSLDVLPGCDFKATYVRKKRVKTYTGIYAVLPLLLLLLLLLTLLLAHTHTGL